MSKHKRTRQQKKIADLRRQLLQIKTQSDQTSTYSTSNTKHAYQVEIDKTFTANSPTQQPDSNTSLYLVPDLLKTGILTGSIIIADLLFFFLLKRHIITLPMLNY